MKKFALTVLVLILPVSSYASSGNGWHKVVQVDINSSKHLTVMFSDYAHTETCVTVGKEKEIVIHKDNVQFERYYSMALSALMADKEVYAWVAGCTDIWGSGDMRATATKFAIRP